MAWLLGRAGDPRRTLRLSAIVVACLVLVVTLAVWGWKTFWELSPTQGELEHAIMMELPPGSSKEAMFAFLDEHGAEHSLKIEIADDSFYLTHDKDVPGDTPMISGLIRNTGRAFLGSSTDLEVYFLLRPDGTLDRYFVHETHGGL